MNFSISRYQFLNKYISVKYIIKYLNDGCKIFLYQKPSSVLPIDYFEFSDFQKLLSFHVSRASSLKIFLTIFLLLNTMYLLLLLIPSLPPSKKITFKEILYSNFPFIFQKYIRINFQSYQN